MGIPRFGLRMRSHAVRTTLGSTERPAKDGLAIIDGPGLAHYIFYQLCDKSNSSPHDFTYAAYADATIKWLRDLQSIGFTIEAILFDGALPATKKDVRIGRLQSYTDRLLAYKELLGSAPPTFSGQARKTLSPPPFLVFAIVEELLSNSEFADRTFMVPGEADPYCVAAAHATGYEGSIVIFSDDADLLVYRLRESASVVPFRDLSVSRTESGNAIWNAEQYWPASIAKRSVYALDDLIKPAYLMAEDPLLTFENACSLLKSRDLTKDSKFATFTSTFQTAAEVGEWARITGGIASRASRPAKDSRVAELIYQLQNHIDGSLRMYLPFVFDDPSMKTAWVVGADLRIMGYSILVQQYKSDVSVQEYRRSGSRIVSSMVEALSEEETLEQAAQLTAHIEQVHTWASKSHELAEDDAWRYLVLQHVLSGIQANGYMLPSAEDSVHIAMNNEQPKWHLVHLSGQYQVAFYSFRMIRQIVAHVLAQGAEGQNTLQRLAHQLNSLPRISAFFSKSETEEKVWRALVREVLSILSESNEEEDERPRKRVKKAKKSGKSQSAVLERNPFAMLAEE